ncbi:MAG TPA: Ig-like domain-containing protein [Gemmatimonadales bacterium]|nr:Ig-like domain-containing protein [Gemmatimonadales bacterium]
MTVITLACGGGGGGTPPGPTPTQIAKTATNNGDNQVGATGVALPTPLAVVVRDASNAPVTGVAVSWAAAAGSGSLTSSSNTDANGVATATWTLGANAGPLTATASKAGLTGSPVTFSATGQVQGATQLAQTTAASGNGQTDTVLATLANPYRVIARDQTNAPVAGVTVSWAVTAGGGGVSAASSMTAATGIATITHTFGGTAGAQSVQATVAGLVGSPVTFTSTANPGVATQIAKNGGDAQTGAINTALATPHSAIVRDAHGNGVSGVTVSWVAGTGGGSVAPTSGPTDATGVASTTRTLGPTAGTQTDTAKAAGLTGSPLVFTATASTLPTTASVSVGDIFFKSVRNMTQNPAIDTIAVGGTVTWNWVGAAGHSVESTGSPSFASSTVMTGVGKKYPFTFTTAGTYTYDCSIHGASMTGTVVVR